MRTTTTKAPMYETLIDRTKFYFMFGLAAGLSVCVFIMLYMASSTSSQFLLCFVILGLLLLLSILSAIIYASVRVMPRDSADDWIPEHKQASSSKIDDFA